MNHCHVRPENAKIGSSSSCPTPLHMTSNRNGGVQMLSQVNWRGGNVLFLSHILQEGRRHFTEARNAFTCVKKVL